MTQYSHPDCLACKIKKQIHSLRIREALVIAKKNGKILGTPIRREQGTIKKIFDMRLEKKTIRDIAKDIGMSKSGVHHILKTYAGEEIKSRKQSLAEIQSLLRDLNQVKGE